MNENDKCKFNLGKVVVTSGINYDMEMSKEFREEILNCLAKYTSCDFSDMKYPEDVQSNYDAIASGEDRIFATYNTSKGEIYIITEWDRSCTTILFPEDY